MPRLLIVLFTTVAAALLGAALPSLAGAAGLRPSAHAAQAGGDRPDGKPIRNGRVAVDTISDRPDIDPGDGICRDRKGRCSLRAAIDEANARATGLRISLQRTRKFTLRQRGAGENDNVSGDLDIRSNVTIVGNDAIVNASRLDRAFHVWQGVRLTIGKTRIANGAPPAGEGGGAILSAGRVELKGARVLENAVSGNAASGGAILNDGGLLILRDTQVNRNSAPAGGGAVASIGGRTYLRRGALLVNTAGLGGGLHVNGRGTADVRATRIDRNTATVQGGGLWLSREGALSVSDAAITRNKANGADAGQGGGGLFTAGGGVRVDRGSISSNHANGANGAGGGILNDGARLLVFGTELRANVARRAGGGVGAIGGRTSFGRVTLTGNGATDATGAGGAVHLNGDGVVDVANSTVSGNVAGAEGGGLWNSAQGRMVVRDTALTGNTAGGNDADQGGGALFNDGGVVTVDRGLVADNRAAGTDGAGGGILTSRGRVDVTGTDIRTNAARRAGGAVEVDAGTLNLVSVSVLDNAAGTTPGNGGAVHVTGAGVVDVRDSQISRNSAQASGGAVANSAEGSVTIARTTFLGNRAGGSQAGEGGGALFNAGGRLSVSGGLLADNHATGANGAGGGVLNGAGGTVGVTGAEIRANSAVAAGGGIWASSAATTTVASTTIGGNVAPRGADVFNQPPGGRFTIDGRAVAPTP